jgi:DNA-directed RNA polymerase II subunit RPB1
MLGSYRISRPNIEFSHRDAMNLLMMYKHVDISKFPDKKSKISNFDVLSQILPSLTIKYKNEIILI